MREDGIVGCYPYMPFNQQMTFPVQLELRSFAEGMRLCRRPVREIELLHKVTQSWQNLVVQPGSIFIPELDPGLYDIRVVVEMGSAVSFGMNIHGIRLEYDAQIGRLTYLGHTIPVQALVERLEMQILVDRSSLELFIQDGKYSASFCFLPHAKDYPLGFFATGANLKLASLTVNSLCSVWE